MTNFFGVGIPEVILILALMLIVDATLPAAFSGRASRSEFWWFVLINLLVSASLMIIDAAIGTYYADAGVGLFSGLYSLSVLIAYMAVSVRRLHDTGRSGRWFLIGFVPLSGAVVLTIFSVQGSQPDSNKYGPNPKEAAPGMA